MGPWRNNEQIRNGPCSYVNFTPLGKTEINHMMSGYDKVGQPVWRGRSRCCETGQRGTDWAWRSHISREWGEKGQCSRKRGVTGRIWWQRKQGVSSRMEPEWSAHAGTRGGKGLWPLVKERRKLAKVEGEGWLGQLYSEKASDVSEDRREGDAHWEEPPLPSPQRAHLVGRGRKGRKETESVRTADLTDLYVWQVILSSGLWWKNSSDTRSSRERGHGGQGDGKREETSPCNCFYALWFLVTCIYYLIKI